MYKYFATCPKGMEQLLAAELTELGASGVRETTAGVAFSGDLETGYRSAMWSRFSSRILFSLTDFEADDDLSLYLGISSYAWEDLFSVEKTISVSFSGQNSEIRSTEYGAVKVKDAIVDRFRKKLGSRPSVDRKKPDVLIYVHLDRKSHVSVSIDISGESLHRREYRAKAGTAPIKENLAAVMVRRSGWDGSTNFIDPMCGSGTILIEAALMALHMAPGLRRKRLGFANLLIHDGALWEKVRAEAEETAREYQEKGLPGKIMGFDRDPEIIGIARENAEKAGVADFVSFGVSELRDLRNPFDGAPAVMVTNPPYGERLGNVKDLLTVYRELGDVLKKEFPGSTAAVISSSKDLLSYIRLRASKVYHLFNGSLSCELRVYSLRERDEAGGQAASESGNAAPSAESLSESATAFLNRFRKNFKRLSKWASREGAEAWRAYDADLPDYNAAIDIYRDCAVIQEYRAPKEIPEYEAHRRLLDMVECVRMATGFEGKRIFLKQRRRQSAGNQYTGGEASGHDDRLELLVTEYGVKYLVNLTDRIDTGIFPDYRLVRRYIREHAKGRSFLNLFCYTGTSSVAAALGGAASVVSVDMSSTYLDWTRENFRLNGIDTSDASRYRFVKADCVRWLRTAKDEGKKYDLVLFDPPTFSNSKSMSGVFSVQDDYLEMLRLISELLTDDGLIIFSNNYRGFTLDPEAVEGLGLSAEDVTARTIPEDYRRTPKIHCCYLVRKICR